MWFLYRQIQYEGGGIQAFTSYEEVLAAYEQAIERDGMCELVHLEIIEGVSVIKRTSFQLLHCLLLSQAGADSPGNRTSLDNLIIQRKEVILCMM